MKIKFYMRTREANGSEVSAQGEVSDKKDIIKQFKEFVKNNGTGFNDFDEFGCLFIKDPDITNGKKESNELPCSGTCHMQ